MARIASLATGLAVLLLPGCGGAESAAPAPPALQKRPAGTLVALSNGNRLTAIDVASGRRTTRRVRSLPACGADLFVTGGHIVFSAVVKGSTTVYSIPLALDRRPTRLGTAHVFVPSATAGRVWLAGTDCDRTEMVGVREVSVQGRETFESARRVPGNWVAAAVPGGLVVSGDGGLVVWDPSTGRASRRLAVEMGFEVRGSLLAGCAEGTECRDLAVVDTATGRAVTARGRLDPAATFSPDGALLAARARSGRRWSVALVDPRTGTTTPVPRSRGGNWYPELAWSASGWLFIRAGARVKAYRPGAARADRLPFRLPRSTLVFAAG